MHIGGVLDEERIIVLVFLGTLTKVCLDVAFNIVYVGDTSVIHQSLKERHELLRRIVKPLKGCLEFLVPNGGTHHSPGKEKHLYY